MAKKLAKHLHRHYNSDFPWIKNLDREFHDNIHCLHYLSTKLKFTETTLSYLRVIENSIIMLDGMRYVYRSTNKEIYAKKIDVAFSIFREEVIDLINFTHSFQKTKSHSHKHNDFFEQRSLLYDLLISLSDPLPAQLSWLHIEENTEEALRALNLPAGKAMVNDVLMLKKTFQTIRFKAKIRNHFLENHQSPFRASATQILPKKFPQTFLKELFSPIVSSKAIERLLDRNYFESTKLESPTTFHLDGTYPLILAGKKKDITNLITMAHETGHAVHYLFGSDSPLVEEFIGQLFEVLAYKKLMKDRRYRKFHEDTERYFWHNFLDFYVQKLYASDTTIQLIKMKKRTPQTMRKISKQNFYEYFGVRESYFDFDYELNEYFYSYEYLVGYIYAYHIGSLIDENPKEFRKITIILKKEKDLTIKQIAKMFKLPSFQVLNQKMLSDLEKHFAQLK